MLELPRGRTPAELAGGFGLNGGPALPGRIEERFQERLAELPPATRLLLLVAAAEPVGDPLLVWKAAASLGIEPGAAAPATDAGLIELGAQVRFRHPLVRSAVYGAAAPEDRRRVHQALAEVTDADVDPDRRAWHRAQATAGLDEDVAAELERSAGRAQARGGLAAGAAFHERAAELTPEPARRARRALAAAQGKHQAGAPDAALRLLAMAQAGPLDELEQARAQLLHAQITFAATRGRDAPPLLLEAAKRLEPLDAGLARATYLEAFAAALVGRPPGARRRCARGRRGGPRRRLGALHVPRACDLLLDGLARLTCEGYTAGAPALKEALRAFRVAQLSEEEELCWLWLACHIARALGDDVAWDELTARQVELARRAGALSLLPVALDDRIHADLFCGRLAAAVVARRRGGRRRGGHRQPPHPARRHRAGQLARPGDRGPGADRGPPARTCCAAARASGSPPPTGAARSATTASAATTRRSPPPSGPPRTRAGSAPRCGCCPTSSRRPSAAASRSAPPVRSSG